MFSVKDRECYRNKKWLLRYIMQGSFCAEISEGYDVRKRQKPSEAAPLIGVCQQTVSKYVDEAKAIVKKFYEDQV